MFSNMNAALKYEKLPGVLPAVVPEVTGLGSYRKHFLNRSYLYAKNAQDKLKFSRDFVQIGVNMLLTF